jgi:hypothetical protein
MHPDKSVGFANIECIVPDIAVFPRADFRRLKRPRVIKSHDCFDPRYRRVIYIVRDPRDVAVSLYHYAKKVNIDDSFPRGIHRKDGCSGRVITVRGESTGSWLVNATNLAEFSMLDGARPPSAGSVQMKMDALGAGTWARFLLVRYMGSLRTLAGLRRIAEFSGRGKPRAD